MTTAPVDSDQPDDGSLIAAVRSGSTQAYAELYERHVGAARNMARQVANSPSEADDLVSEAFAKVLSALQAGNGPTSAFRAYLLTSLRHTAYDRSRRDRKLHLSEDVTRESGADVGVPFTDPAVAGLERSLAAQAFARLPERWQAVLWHVEIEGQGPGDVAAILGLSPNGVSALAYRAREGLRQSYLQVHLRELESAGPGVEKCRATAERLGAWTRRGLSKRETAQVDAHLDSCARCRSLAAELAEVNGGLRAVVAPLVLGAGAAGYLATAPGGAAGAASVASAGAAGGAAGTVSSLPRQMITTAASVGALGVAVALGLFAGGAQREPVAAAPPTRPPAVKPDRPGPQPPPAPEAPQPPPASKPPRPPMPPPPQVAEPADPPIPAPPAPPARPSLTATGPGAPIRLVAGGAPERMPIEIRNAGTAPSAPVTTRITLPAGVTATLPGGSPPGASSEPASTEPASTVPQAVSSQPQAQPVHCRHERQVLTCTTEAGLEPSESINLAFRVRAREGASDGDISVEIVSTGVTVPLAPVHIDVRPPEPAPAITLDARATSWHQVPWLGSRVDMHATNTGRIAGQAVVTLQLPRRVRAYGIDNDCRRTATAIRCRDHIEPGQSLDVSVWFRKHPCTGDRCRSGPARRAGPSRVQPQGITLTATARLGTASDSATVDLHPWWHPGWPHWPDENADRPGHQGNEADQRPGNRPPSVTPTGKSSTEAPPPSESATRPSETATRSEQPSTSPTRPTRTTRRPDSTSTTSPRTSSTEPTPDSERTSPSRHTENPSSPGRAGRPTGVPSHERGDRGRS